MSSLLLQLRITKPVRITKPTTTRKCARSQVLESGVGGLWR
jgi:hypothetical protein